MKGIYSEMRQQHALVDKTWALKLSQFEVNPTCKTCYVTLIG